MSQVTNSFQRIKAIPGRIRILIPKQHRETMPKDKFRTALRAMPGVESVKFSKRSILIEYNETEEHIFDHIEEVLKRFFPENYLDWLELESPAAAVHEGSPYPLKSMSTPILLGVIAWRAMQTGTLWQFETALAAGYIGFDLWWNSKHKEELGQGESSV